MRKPVTLEDIARYVVTEAIWAPSVHNTQPWRFLADGQQISLYADAYRGLPVADPGGREMMISCGWTVSVSGNWPDGHLRRVAHATTE
jgi:hypothetical protein